jgi:cytochrome c peroxidase
MCAACHVADWTAVADYALPVQVPAWAPAGMVPPVFTDFTFDNLGIPKSQHPLLTGAPVDLGLGSFLGDEAENGKFKVMTVRNIGLSAPYGHNGYFDRMKDIVHFYNTRDVPGALPKGMDWDPPEFPATVNFDELGNLGLSDDDEDALVEFMKTLSDGFKP